MIECYYHGFLLKASLKTENWQLAYHWEYFDPEGEKLSTGKFTGNQNQLILAFQCWVNHKLWVFPPRKATKKVKIPKTLSPRKAKTKL